MSALTIGQYWRGEGPLWRVYWLHGVLGSSSIALLILLAVGTGLVGPTATFVILAGGTL
ncbi:MAG: hypothetical protein KIT81_01895 [Alphaproteobacteria bacterium]|nr:hypothetical protein [Alphaproteobacteria bacterium]